MYAYASVQRLLNRGNVLSVIRFGHCAVVVALTYAVGREKLLHRKAYPAEKHTGVFIA